MCGRYTVFDPADISEMRAVINEINRRFSAPGGIATVKNGEIYPSDTAPALLPDKAEGQTAAPLKWGFPHPAGRGLIINARSESVAFRPMFRESFSCRRCVLPATGFFEWKHSVQSGRKEGKTLLRRTDAPVMYMAGLYNSFPKNTSGQLSLTDSPEDPAEQETAFVIITTGANEYVSPLHDRMPLILEPEQVISWLHDRERAAALLRQRGPALALTPA